MYPKSIRPLSSVEVRTCIVLLATVEVDMATVVVSLQVQVAFFHVWHRLPQLSFLVRKRGSGPALGLTADRPQSDRAIARADHSSACIALEATPAGALLLNRACCAA